MNETDNNSGETTGPRALPRPPRKSLNFSQVPKNWTTKQNALIKLNNEYTPKEWEPAPRVDELLAPRHNIFVTIFGAGKWLQVCQLTFLFCALIMGLGDSLSKIFGNSFHIPFTSRNQDAIYITSAVLSIFYIIQFVYGYLYKQLSKKAIAHYNSYSVFDNIPPQAIKQRHQIYENDDKAGKCIASSVLGIFLIFAFITAVAVLQSSRGLTADFRVTATTILYVLFMPSLIAWVAIHYSTSGVICLFILIGSAILESVFGFPVLLCAIVLFPIIYALVDFSQHTSALKFYGVMGSFTLIATLISMSLFGAYKLNIALFILAITICFLPAILTFIMKACFGKFTDESDSPDRNAQMSQNIENLLYSYIWSGLCGLYLLSTLIITIIAYVQADKDTTLNALPEKTEYRNYEYNRGSYSDSDYNRYDSYEYGSNSRGYYNY